MPPTLHALRMAATHAINANTAPAMNHRLPIERKAEA